MPLPGPARLVGLQIVEPDPRMGIEDAERRRLLAQMREDQHEHDVLHDVGEIAGMEGVAVVHGRSRMGRIDAALPENAARASAAVAQT